MSSVPLLATQIRPPESPLDTFGRNVQLANLLQEQRIRQQMAPVQLQTAQAQAKTAGIGAQEAEMEYGYKKKLYDAFADPNFKDEAFGDAQTVSGNQPGSQPSSQVAFNPDSFVQALSKRGVPAPLAIQAAQPFLEYSKSQAALTKDQQDIHNHTLGELTDRIAPILDEKDPQKQQLMQQQFGEYLKDPSTLSGLTSQEQQEAQAVSQVDAEHLPLVAGLLGMTKKISDYHKAQADAQVAQLDAFKKSHDIPTDDDWRPEHTLAMVNGLIPQGLPDQRGAGADPVLQHFREQAANTFRQNLSSTMSVEAARKSIDPIVEAANRYVLMGPDKKATMLAADQQNRMLAAPVADLYKEQVNVGGQMFNVTDTGRTKGIPQGEYVNSLNAQAGYVPMDEKALSSLRALSADSQNLQEAADGLQRFVAKNAGTRLLQGPINKLKQIFQTDPDLAAARGILELDSLKTSRDLLASEGQGGMRGVPPELTKIGSALYPQVTDDAATFLKKVQNLQKQYQQVATTTVGRPGIVTRGPQAAPPSEREQLMKTDPNFANLTPQEQDQYLQWRASRRAQQPR